jgi:hypothetical protein
MVWDRSQPFGSSNSTGHALIPLFVAVYLLNEMFRNGPLAQAILYATIIDASIIGWYCLIKQLLNAARKPPELSNASLASLCGALFATFNTYAIFYEWRIVNTDIFLQASLPWLLLCIYTLCRRDSARRPLRYWATVGFVIASWLIGPGLSNPLMLPVAALPSVCVFGILARKMRIYRAVALTGTAVAIQAYWLVPVLTDVSGVRGEALFGGKYTALISNSSHLGLLNVIRFTGMLPVWEAYKQEPDFPWAHIYSGDGLWAAFLMIPVFLWIIAASGMWKGVGTRRDASIVLAVVVVGIVLSSGANGPFGVLYRVAFNKLPYFSGYRDPYLEFGFALAISFGILLAYGVVGAGELLSRWQETVGNSG